MNRKENTNWFAGIAGMLLLHVTGWAADGPESCLSSREYITTLEFLRSEKDLALKNEDAMKLADSVSLGCTGAGERFIRVSNVLIRAGLGSKDAIEIAREYALKSESEENAFINIFKKAFVSEFLDLDLRTSIQLARELSGGFGENTEKVLKDFDTWTDYCSKKKKLDLPAPQCAQMASRIARAGGKHGGDISGPFIGLLDFLTEEKRGPKITTVSALEIAEEIVSVSGPIGPENFKIAYLYAVSEQGLKLSEADAIAFAKNLSDRTVQKK